MVYVDNKKTDKKMKSDFEKWKRTDEPTDDMCKNNDHYRPCVGRPSGSIKFSRYSTGNKKKNSNLI